MLVAVSMFRDEADVAAHTIRHLIAEGVERFIVADNRSVDGTGDILRSFPQVTVIEDDEAGYYQDRKMSHLSDLACEAGAEWVLPFDADECWYSPSGTIAGALASCPDGVVMAPGWDHITTTDTPPVCPFAVPGRKQGTQQMVKVAYRAHRGALLHMGNHDVQHPGSRTSGPLAYRHFQYRTLEQMARKLRNGREAYEASDIHPMHGTHWREGGLLSDEEMADRWDGLKATPNLLDDPAPARCCP